MSYEAVYINPCLQFGCFTLDLILIDSDKIMPDIRIGKKFRNAEQVTEEAIEAEAKREIIRCTEEFVNGRL